MTEEDFKGVIPGSTIIAAETDEGIKRMIVKFFMCNTDNFDGYWMCCTEDLTNPYPNEVREDDWNIYANKAEIVDSLDNATICIDNPYKEKGDK